PRPPRTPFHLPLPDRHPRASRPGRRPARNLQIGGGAVSPVAPTLQAFFTERLIRQRQASPKTIESYRDTLRLLLSYVHATTGKPPAALGWDDLGHEIITSFLDHLEASRGNTTRTRNLRLTAIRSL